MGLEALMGFVKRYILPGVVCIVLTFAFWIGMAYVKAWHQESVDKDRLLYAVAQIVDHNLKAGKLEQPPPSK